MDADYDIFEIVAVIRDFWLVGAKSCQRKYYTNHGRQPWTSGNYVVNRQEHFRARRFNERIEFHGLFKLRKEAQAALDRMNKEWERVLTMASGIAPVAILKANRMEVKKTASQGLQLAKDARAIQTFCGHKPCITGFTCRLPENSKSGSAIISFILVLAKVTVLNNVY